MKKKKKIGNFRHSSKRKQSKSSFGTQVEDSVKNYRAHNNFVTALFTEEISFPV